MRYGFDTFYNMDENTFCSTFSKKHVIITMKDGSKGEGKISLIELAWNVNPDTHDHLPVKIKFNGALLPLDLIEEIEVL